MKSIIMIGLLFALCVAMMSCGLPNSSTEMPKDTTTQIAEEMAENARESHPMQGGGEVIKSYDGLVPKDYKAGEDEFHRVEIEQSLVNDGNFSFMNEQIGAIKDQMLHNFTLDGSSTVYAMAAEYMNDFNKAMALFNATKAKLNL